MGTPASCLSRPTTFAPNCRKSRRAAACAEASGVLAVRFTSEERFRVRRQIETRRELAVAGGDTEARLILSLAAAIAPDRDR